jgi:hypothetical protein
MLKNYFFFLLFIFLFINFLPAQEALKSIEEDYYDFLALQGLTERPYLNYRTLSDSVWNINEEADHPWIEQKSGVFHPLFGDFRLRVYGPELFSSYNTAAPYGQYDGVLWQGRGFNSLFKSGVRFEGYGFELTLLPHFSFSQNAVFDIMPSDFYDSKYGYIWGYAHNTGVDAPQRFGDKPFFDWDFGDSEIRYTWKTLTIGFGTQAIWLGPSFLNPILHSNNAPSYPKIDIGLRRQKVTIPWLDWYAGDIEIRLWVGRLSESNYFDNDDSNNYTMLHGLSISYAPSFLPGFTMFFNRACLAFWETESLKYMIPSGNNITEDQKETVGFSWIFPYVGFELFAELGVDDNIVGGTKGIVRYPFHTTVFSAGLKKTLNIKSEKKIYGEIMFEFNWMEMTQDFQLMWFYSFYFHHEMIHGYTNRGQYIGNGISPGGNSQQLSFVLYYPNGKSLIFMGRNNPDSNFILKNAVYASAEDKKLIDSYYEKFKANFNIGLNTDYFLNSTFIISGGLVYNIIINPQYHYDNAYDAEGNVTDSSPAYQHNFSFRAGIKIRL